MTFRPHLVDNANLISECREYAQFVYTTVKVPSQMFGEPPTMKKIDKCMYKAVSLIVGGEAVKVRFEINLRT